MNKKPQLLAPAGDYEKLLFAIAYGADAVYLGGEEFGLRVKSNNFTLEEIKKAVDYAHDHGVKVYITVNIFAHNEDIEALPQYLSALNDIRPDGLLISDLGVFMLAKEYAGDIPLHISTQANSVNYKTVEAWEKLGASRVVLGRELSLEEIALIAKKTDAELEIFVHGAMCMSYSGRCLLSNYLTGRDANRGACSHPCRWQYVLMEQDRKGEYMPVEEDSHGTYIMNSKDLNLLPFLPDFIDLGLSSLKIEGRVKTAYYVSVVTKVYREALDLAYTDREAFAAALPRWQQELTTVSHRQYATGFLEGKPTADHHRYETSAYVRGCDFIAVVRDYDPIKKMLQVEQRNHFKVGDTLEVLNPIVGAKNDSLPISEMYDAEGKAIAVAPHPQMTVYLPYPNALPPYAILRRKI